MNPSPPILAFFQNLGVPEMLVIGILALLIFGRRLPEVGRSLGKSIVEFKKGLSSVEEDVKDMSTINSSATPRQIGPPPAHRTSPAEDGKDAAV
jgi:sec-independent protein translocase protein TatA